MKLTFEVPNTTNLEGIIAYLIAEGAILTEEARKNALRSEERRVGKECW